MALTFIALRSVVFSCGFLWLWTWAALTLRRFDLALGGPLPAWTHALGLPLLAVGGAVAVWCIGTFVVRGHGTPAPFDAPRRFVAAGPYSHARNPMYMGGALLLLGLGLDQWSPSIILFAPAWWVLFHLLVILYEEPVLRSKFGRDYDAYCRRTPRWIPRLMRPSLAGSAALLLPFAMLLHGALRGPDRRTDRTERWTLSPDGKRIAIARQLSGETHEARRTIVLEKR